MKKILIGFVLVIGTMGANLSFGYNMGCGLPPLPPLGCTGQPQCVCTSDSCTWIWPNCR